MIFQVNDTERINSNTNCWVTEVKKTIKKKNGEEYDKWEPVSYHSKLVDALSRSVERNLRESNTQTSEESIIVLEDVIRRYSALVKQIKEALTITL